MKAAYRVSYAHATTCGRYRTKEKGMPSRERVTAQCSNLPPRREQAATPDRLSDGGVRRDAVVRAGLITLSPGPVGLGSKKWGPTNKGRQFGNRWPVTKIPTVVQSPPVGSQMRRAAADPIRYSRQRTLPIRPPRLMRELVRSFLAYEYSRHPIAPRSLGYDCPMYRARRASQAHTCCDHRYE
jgi:hypothetical protein